MWDHEFLTPYQKLGSARLGGDPIWHGMHTLQLHGAGGRAVQGQLVVRLTSGADSPPPLPLSQPTPSLPPPPSPSLPREAPGVDGLGWLRWVALAAGAGILVLLALRLPRCLRLSSAGAPAKRAYAYSTRGFAVLDEDTGGGAKLGGGLATTEDVPLASMSRDLLSGAKKKPSSPGNNNGVGGLLNVELEMYQVDRPTRSHALPLESELLGPELAEIAREIASALRAARRAVAAETAARVAPPPTLASTLPPPPTELPPPPPSRFNPDAPSSPQLTAPPPLLLTGAEEGKEPGWLTIGHPPAPPPLVLTGTEEEPGWLTSAQSLLKCSPDHTAGGAVELALAEALAHVEAARTAAPPLGCWLRELQAALRCVRQLEVRAQVKPILYIYM